MILAPAAMMWLFAGAVMATVALAQNMPTVKIQNGTLQGIKCPSTDVNAFFSIPYAKPPVRFSAPKPYDQEFNGTLNATVAAPSCPQFYAAWAETGPQSEDCLYLDIWVPSSAQTRNTSSLPVKVWLYGGADLAGGISDPLYDGCFASESTIQVSVNYRVGPLGYLAYSPLGLTGNYGTQDQLLALRWVHENIASFGGNPTRVMLFGQSAGADNTFILSSNPDAAKILHSAVLQSGSYPLFPSITSASKANQAFISQLNCSDPTTGLACLRNANITAMTTLFQSSGAATASTFGPVLDHAIIPSQPAHPLVPTIVGSTTQEGSLLVAGYNPNATAYTQADYLAWLATTFPGANPATTTSLADTIAAAYPPSRFANNSASQPPIFAAMSTITTLAQFTCPARRLLRALAAAHVPAWTYRFGRTPSCAWFPPIAAAGGPEALRFLGATHTAEIPFVMGQVSGLPRPDGGCDLTEGERRLSGFLMGAWDRMAEGAKPGVEGWGSWKEGPGGGKGLNVLADATWAVEEVDFEGCDFWDEIAAAMAL